MRRSSARLAERLPNTSFFAMPGMKAETAQIAFDLAGVALSAGSACSSGKVGPSHVLKAMGHGGDAGALRVSLGRATSEAEIERFLAALDAILARRTQAGGLMRAGRRKVGAFGVCGAWPGEFAPRRTTI